ncbi:MAG: hypothetical protein ACRDN8_15235 [Thermoleophilaceae bacterium]
MALMVTRIKVANFDDWKATFDTDPVQARGRATGYRILRGVEDPSEVYVQVEFPSDEAAREARGRLLESGVLDRQLDHHGPTLVEEADAVRL